MIIRLPSEIAKVLVMDGGVYARTTTGQVKPGLALRLDGHHAPFESITKAEEAKLSFTTKHRPNFGTSSLLSTITPTSDRSDKAQSVWLNELADWSLVNGETLQLMIPDASSPRSYELGAQIQVPAHGQPLQFRALVAAHRAQARLEVCCTSADTEDRFEQKFDNKHLGGLHEDGYLLVIFTLPPNPQAATLQMTLKFDKSLQKEQEADPYIFLANPHVTALPEPEKTICGLQYMADHPEEKGAEWLYAAAPGLVQAGSSLRLKTGEAEVAIFEAEDTVVFLDEDFGHTLMLRASKPQAAVLYVNGHPERKVAIGTDPTPVQLPKAHLDGAFKKIALRDASGTQTFFETYVLAPRNLTSIELLQREGGYPYPGVLMAQAQHRYAGLKAHLAAGITPEQQTQISYAVEVLEGGYENVKLAPLSFAPQPAPDVSIIIPAHNKVEVTYLALCSLLVARTEASFEVIIVDDASTDETAKLEEIVSGITVVHNETPQRFIRACNAGVDKARGKYVVLLNNDVEVTVGWLDELIAGFSRFGKVGLVGAKLLYPNGTLQDAGGIIWRSGNPWNYGSQKNPWAPEFSYARQADYLSGAAMMTTREIWQQVDGLSKYLEPMYFEDTDFAFKIREAGYKTYFIPSAVVYHYEGMTSGTDVTSGFKRYQEVNRPKFKRRWSGAFAGRGIEGTRPDLEKDRGIHGRVLFIDYTTPRPDCDAGSYAALQEMKLVQSLGYKVTFLPQNAAYMGSYTEDLQKMGIEVICAPFFLSIADYLDKHGADFDAFFITRYYVGSEAIPVIRRVAPKAKILFNNADLHFLRELRAALSVKDPDRVQAARATRSDELSVMGRCDVILSYNDTEHSVITSHLEGAVPVLKCPWVVTVPDQVPGLAARKGMSFLGSYNHYPNVDGVQWFVADIMPQITAAEPDLDLTIYGSGMSKLKGVTSPHVQVAGFVERIEDSFDQHRIFVAPLLSGAGIKGKVLSALAHGIPCVLSPLAAESIGLRHGLDCFIAETPAEWAEAVSRLNTDDALWETISQNARSYMAASYSFDKGRALMRAAFEAVEIFSDFEE